MDIQFVFVILIALLTGSAVVVSVYVIFVLKDFRGTIGKANDILDDAQKVTSSIKNPIVSVMSIADGLVRGIKTARGISSIVGAWDKDDSTKERRK
ncbi:hypothetical protein COT50_03110 [candidate division WWE3 bacterium CG08_land_8_20_14_0_20_41_10]|uniref:DUF948 domain-containing protein n=1 Tax=candidate division WWE3 bacterium CG08_land_8_20_14_0_20_41_10 TaxID=1975085 RepID=A0A2H0XBA5_UNCKA|nr:MAG: hypothetical protein COT50_03110 [candidate division WWE3 bacterium CG08_land_8_20_14_0_20_41_10]